jgi:hypothetical protein
MSPKPIFIIGRHRSGTSWLSNILASVPGVYAPRTDPARSPQESAFFSHLVPYCNHGRTNADLLAIKFLFERSAYFSLTGLVEGPEILRNRPAGYFRLVMDAAAGRRDAAFWLEKTPAHTLCVRFLVQAFPDAVMLAVTRDYRDVVSSNVHGFDRPTSLWAWLRQSAVTAIYEKVIEHHKIFVVRYESLESDYDATVRSAMARVGLNAAAVPQNTFSKNTSFPDRAARTSGWQRAAMLAGRWVVLVWPASAVERAVSAWLERKRAPLPSWLFP